MNDDDKFDKMFATKSFGAQADYRSASCENRDSSMTYRSLLMALQQLTPAQLDQPAQILPPDADLDSPVHLEPIIGFGTVEEMCHVGGEVATETRDTRHFKHLPGQVILLRDSTPFGKYGDTAYTLLEGGKMVGNKSGRVFDGFADDDGAADRLT